MCDKNLGRNLAILFAGISLVCGIVVYAVPGMAHTLLSYLTHSTWQFAIRPFDPINFVIGLLLWAAIGFVIGSIFSKLSEWDNKTDKKGD
ncbi:hypothetical protein HY988_07495 [Candidatus Micrarchaeota archaeon]|nr:hypothetical protein [Candidatus Micrarchaeota archaeon]